MQNEYFRSFTGSAAAGPHHPHQSQHQYPSNASSSSPSSSFSGGKNSRRSPFVHLNHYEVLAWSVAGNETCVIVKSPQHKIDPLMFDIGVSLREGVPCSLVFISHGHIDHIAALVLHARKRNLQSLPTARYYMPASIVPHVYAMLDAFNCMHDSDRKLLCRTHPETGESSYSDCIFPVQPGDIIHVRNLRVQVFGTHHRTDSVGYLMHRRAYQTMPGGPPLEEWVPAIAYLGDTQFSIFSAPDALPGLLWAELLISEATYLDKPEQNISRAEKFGHCHLDQYRQNAHLFANVGQLLLIHLSDRYSPSTAVQLARNCLPEWLFAKTFLSTLAKSHGL